jgi:flagellar hook-associated protein 2
MAALTAQGLGSGLDINGLVSKLVAAEGDPKKAQLTRQETKLTAEFSAIGTLKSALSSVQSSLAKLDQGSDFEGVKATSANEELFTASATADAATGQYQIQTLRLAQAHKLASATFDGDKTFGGADGDGLSLTVDGNSLEIDLAGGKTLAQIRDAVNEAADNPGVRATLVNLGDGQQALVLTAAETGYAKRIEVTERFADSDSLSLASANRDAGGNVLADLADLDAAAMIDGITVTGPTNELADAIDGVTLNLGSADPGTWSTLSVGLDTGSIGSAVSGFVQSYNALVKTLRSLSGFKGEGMTQPALFGDSMTRSIGARLRSVLGSTISGLEGDVSSLSDIGITASLDGSLTIDSAKLNEALDADPHAVSALFSSDEGYAVRLDSVLSSYLDYDGILDARTKGLQASIDDLKDRREVLDRRLTELEARYTQQFNALDTLLGQLSSTSDYLAQQLASLPGSASSDSGR